MQDLLDLTCGQIGPALHDDRSRAGDQRRGKRRTCDNRPTAVPRQRQPNARSDHVVSRRSTRTRSIAEESDLVILIDCTCNDEPAITAIRQPG